MRTEINRVFSHTVDLPRSNHNPPEMGMILTLILSVMGTFQVGHVVDSTISIRNGAQLIFCLLWSCVLLTLLTRCLICTWQRSGRPHDLNDVSALVLIITFEIRLEGYFRSRNTIVIRVSCAVSGC